MANAQNAATWPERPDQVEFVVKPECDLILDGSERTITRVAAGTPYSCLMLKTQRFSSLFRHYAKHHGLRKEDLSFFFCEELENDDTPESVFLQKNDEIVVRKRKPPPPPPPAGAADTGYFRQMRSLLDDSEHKDVCFLVGPRRQEVRAHKAILVARGEYFRGLFRTATGMRESVSNEMVIEKHSVPTLERMLEYMYTNRVEHLKECSAHEVLDLLSTAEEYLLPELKHLCEHAAQPLISTEMVARMMSAADRFDAPVLREACIRYILGADKHAVIDHPSFRAELESYPHMLFPIIKAAPTLQGGGNGSSSSSSPSNKRPRTDSHAGIARLGMAYDLAGGNSN